ncbi:MAG: glycosyltransferase, partial [Sphingobacteriia bacterium]|nr:glycosyltransferase [Candidatus Fonsibacter lacus]
IVCSEDVKKDVLKYDRVSAKKLIIINSFAMFDFKKDYSINLNEKFNLSAETFKLLTIARIVEQKGLFLLVDAIDICVNAFKMDQIKLFIIGDGPLRKDLVDYINIRKLGDYIFLIGEQNNLNTFLTQCNAYIDPSLWAGMNVASIKALEASLPLLITDVGGARKLTCEGKYGVLCKANDAHSLAFGIESLLVKKKVNTKEAYEYIRENFSDTTAGKKIGEIYKSLLMKI